ncbi:MAG: hypothetical protein AAGM67_12055, partial [Bacteroidota bacterium]
MSPLQKFTLLTAGALVALAFWSFTASQNAPSLVGAWQLVDESGGSEQTTWVFAEDYMSKTTFDIANKVFVGTKGGRYYGSNTAISEIREFDTWNPENALNEQVYEIVWGEDPDRITVICGRCEDKSSQVWQRIDDGRAPLAGAWQITKRMQEGEMREIHRTGSRKTVKLLSGTRFQWIAIDPDKKGFYGTGGGSYTFEDGVYTENIEFFSRDSSRVGMSLSFQGAVSGNDWSHSGKSSKGKPINAVIKSSVVKLPGRCASASYITNKYSEEAQAIKPNMMSKTGT